MPNEDTKQSWDRFESDVKGLAGELRRHYRDAADTNNAVELNRSLEQLGQAAGAVFASVENATRDPEVRSRTRQTARSFGSALAETFRELSEDLEKSLRGPAATK